MEEARAAKANKQPNQPNGSQSQNHTRDDDRTESGTGRAGMEFEMETAQQTREPPPMENQVEKSALLDLNAPPRESMMIIPTPTILQPNTGRTVYHMTFQPSWNQTTIHNIPRRDITQTTTIHSYHYIQTHTPIQVDPPRITHLPGPDEILPFPDHPSLPKPYTVENPPDTPPPPRRQSTRANQW